MSDRHQAVIVIELRVGEPEEIATALMAMNPPSIPGFTGAARVAIDDVATALVEWLDEGTDEERLGVKPGAVASPAGFVVVRDEDGEMVCDWDGEIHPTRDDAEAELELAKRQEPLYEWYLAEVRPAEVPF